MLEQKHLAFRVFSDLDDTIKISNTQRKLALFYRGLFRSSAFMGMAELYQEWATSASALPVAEASELHPSPIQILSSSPPVLSKKIKNFLSQNKFPAADLYLRNWITQPSIRKYKSEALEALASKFSEPLILIGDDTEHDPEVISKFKSKYPGRVIAAYVRQVKGRKLPDDVKGFFTAFDIACAEVAAGRLTTEQAARVGKAVLQAKKLRRVIPTFSTLPPKEYRPKLPEGENPLTDLWNKIQSRLITITSKK